MHDFDAKARSWDDPAKVDRARRVAALITARVPTHHVPDTAALLRRLHAALEPGGYLCVSDLDAEDGSFHGAGFDGHDGFDHRELERQLAGAGFAEIRFEGAFEIRKPAACDEERSFPAFLAVARKPEGSGP